MNDRRENYGNFLEPITALTYKSAKKQDTIELDDFAESVDEEKGTANEIPANEIHTKEISNTFWITSVAACLSVCTIGCIYACNRRTANP
jgi:hypothetical protein